jgi:hypothetical protein
MLIVALVMAVIGLAALVTAVVTGNEVIAWACIGASVIGVLLLIGDALRERPKRDAKAEAESTDDEEFDAEYPDEDATVTDESDKTQVADPKPGSTEENPAER